jgi:myo-inositol 2-dehydrogenase/D-chiro-inositol 1-dehydrogenase
MTAQESSQPAGRAHRREFVRTTTLSAGGALASLASLATLASLAPVAGSLALPWGVHAAGSDILKIGLVGCGSRGTGAAVDAMNADAHAKLYALGDLVPGVLQASLKSLRQEKGAQVDVSDERRFVGFDSCKRVIESGVDVVLLALPTFFHPPYLKACVEAGKHVFCEKTHAVDAPGVRMVQAAADEARRKGLSIVSGLAWRYDTGAVETMKRVHDGAIGEIVTLEETCNTGSLRSRDRRPGWTEMEYQIQDWFNFFWLSCDLPGLNLVHDLDKGAWAMHDQPPVRCWGMGGRQTRVGPQYGDVWDHHAIVYQYANGARMHAYCRQQDGCVPDVSDRFYGTKGRCDLLNYRIDGAKPWRYGKPASKRFDLEHAALFSAIRSGKPVNNGIYMARSSLLAIMATWACYTGEVITWEQAMRSNHVVAPTRLAIDADPPTKPDASGNYPMPIPGVTRFR